MSLTCLHLPIVNPITPMHNYKHENRIFCEKTMYSYTCTEQTLSRLNKPKILNYFNRNTESTLIKYMLRHITENLASFVLNLYIPTYKCTEQLLR